MDEHFYTPELGPIYGPKLEALADEAGFDDVEEFAAMLLRRAIDSLESSNEAELQSYRKLAETACECGSQEYGNIDDDIPF